MGFDPSVIVDCVEELLADHAGEDPFIPINGVDQEAAQKMIPIPGGGGGHILLTDTAGETWMLTIQRCAKSVPQVRIDSALARSRTVKPEKKKGGQHGRKSAKARTRSRASR